MAQLPIQFRSGVPTVQVSIDGQLVTMVLDLGAQTSLLVDDTADKLNLARDPSLLPTITGVGGSGARWAATARHLALGSLVLTDKRLEVAQLALNGGRHQIDGLIGLDILRRYDIDWDLPHHLVTLNAAAGCDGPPQNWASPAVAVPLEHHVAFAAYSPMSKLLLLPVSVDHRPLTALLDTGAAFSMISPEAAAELEPPRNGDRSLQFAGVGADSPTGTVHRFGSLTVAGDTIATPQMMISSRVPIAVGSMILGVGFMRIHRAWLPADEDRIWFGPRDVGPVGPPGAAVAATAPGSVATTAAPASP